MNRQENTAIRVTHLRLGQSYQLKHQETEIGTKPPLARILPMAVHTDPEISAMIPIGIQAT